MNPIRKRKLAHLLLAGVLGMSAVEGSFAKTVTDILGRKVEMPQNPERIILGEGRMIQALAILEGPAVAQKLAGVQGDFERFDPDGYEQYIKRFPELASVPRFGIGTTETVSAETMLTLHGDVAIFSASGGHGPSANSDLILKIMEKAGVPVIFVDFRNDPIRHAPESIRIMGEVLSREKQAQAFTRFYKKELARVVDVLKKHNPPRPRVFLESRVGLHSGEIEYETMSHGMMGIFVDLAGGDNLAKAVVPGAVGKVGLEYLITRQPEHYIGTAIGSRKAGGQATGRIVLGAGVDSRLAGSTLHKAVMSRSISRLDVFSKGQVHAIWHHFYCSPFNVAAVQAMAKWFHPGLFSELDPEATLKTCYESFQPVPYEGTYWTTIDPGP